MDFLKNITYYNVWIRA